MQALQLVRGICHYQCRHVHQLQLAIKCQQRQHIDVPPDEAAIAPQLVNVLLCLFYVWGLQPAQPLLAAAAALKR